MNQESQLSLLAAQIECAKSRSEHAREVGEDATAIERIVGSLRTTYAAVASGLSPEWIGSQAFVLEIGPHRQHAMNLGDRPVPVSGPYLEALLKQAGLQLEPEQVILLEAGLVRDLVEEALGRIAHDQAMAEKERAELQAILTRAPEFRVESVEHAIEEALGKADQVRRRKVALLSAGLALDELREPTGCPQRAA